MKFFIAVFTFIYFVNQLGIANTLSFDDFWIKIKDASPEISLEDHNFNAADLAVGRAQKHWLPSLTLSASAYSSNDPGANFFGNLSQRQINTFDFNPSTLNTPGFNNFEVGTLGIVFPLYEGGSKQAELNALTKMRESQLLIKSEMILKEYTELAIHYAQLMSLSKAKIRISALIDRVSDVLSHYSIGKQSNPIGYSGILGLKSLKNRLQGELLNIQSKEVAQREVLTEKAKFENNNWKISSEDILPFLDRKLSPSKNQKISLRESALLVRSESYNDLRDAERSRYRPKIGLFANESMTNGDRSTATSFAVGVYLNWSLFGPDNINRVSEKEELRRAELARLEMERQTNSIENKVLLESESSMKQGLILLLESEQLLSEQVKVADKLFQSGSISGLQFAEVLNRRVDLILNLLALENNLIDTRGKRVRLTQVEGVSL
ncbi:MAG: TolC family protein [Bacteriovoracaceae bacterium]|nr:TolC family protein [Bacteriovoracaceae bacterium]